MKIIISGMLRTCASLIVGTLIYSTNANAVFIDAFGAAASASTRENCAAGFVCSTGNTIDSASDAGSGILSASAAIVGAEAHADLNTANGLAFLSAFVEGASTEGANASVEAIRKYEYTGATPFTLQLDATYHGVLTGVSRAMMSGSVALILADPANPTDSLINTFLDSGISIGGALFQVANNDFSNLFRDSMNVTDEGDQTFTLNLTVDLNPGDQFYLYNSFSLLGYDGGIVDGLNSASMSVNTLDFRVLQRTSVVPVPAAVWLFGSGLIGLVAVSRRRG